MHLFIAAITALAGLPYALSALQQADFDLNSLPFLACRRWQWRRFTGTKPIYRNTRA
jgi:hypothetical protein